MMQSIRAVALRTVKYNDKSSILTSWSAELGAVALLMPAGGGAESRRRRALTMPLSLFECVADVRPGREILPVKDVRPLLVGADLASNPVRATVAMFLAEILTALTHEGGPDATLWAFLEESITALGRLSGRELANFHLVFLTRLATVTGIEPDLSTWTRNRGLDLLDGVFRTSHPLHDHWLEPDGARIARMLLSMGDYSHLAFPRFDRATRNATLTHILNYFTLHHTSLENLHTLPVVRTVLG